MVSVGMGIFLQMAKPLCITACWLLVNHHHPCQLILRDSNQRRSLGSRSLSLGPYCYNGASNTGGVTTRALFLACNVCSTVIGVNGTEYYVHFFKRATLGFGD